MNLLNTISDYLVEKINTVPSLPGIYKMLDSNRNIIYIGKSVSLDKRVKSYFVKNHTWEKLNRMVPLIKDIEFQITDTHLEARLLECKLIKKIKPFFNSQYKNDKKYVYLKIKDYNINNPLAIVYEQEKNTYGPIKNKSRLEEIVNFFRNIYPITKKHGKYDFNYNIIPLTIEKESFQLNKKILEKILSEDKSLIDFIDVLELKMKEAASLYLFETASLYRDMIVNIKYLNNSLYGYKDMYSKNILLKIPTSNGYKLFFVSKGQILLKRKYEVLKEKDIQVFIDKGKSLLAYANAIKEDKSSIDFRNILYSEIKSLPEENVEILI